MLLKGVAKKLAAVFLVSALALPSLSAFASPVSSVISAKSAALDVKPAVLEAEPSIAIAKKDAASADSTKITLTGGFTVVEDDALADIAKAYEGKSKSSAYSMFKASSGSIWDEVNETIKNEGDIQS